jgi:hypothetical protein
MDEPRTRITTDKQVPGHWRVTLNHPPGAQSTVRRLTRTAAWGTAMPAQTLAGWCRLSRRRWRCARVADEEARMTTVERKPNRISSLGRRSGSVQAGPAPSAGRPWTRLDGGELQPELQA